MNNKNNSDELLETTTYWNGCELESILDFIDHKNNLMGKIGVYKINFNKNLRRFQEIAAEQANAMPQVTVLVNKFMSETLLPSIWQVSSNLGQSTKFMR